MNTKTRCGTALLITAAAITAGPFRPACAAETVDRIEEIVVTARKQAESIQDVPISMAAFSAVDLEQRSVQVLGDVARFTPNVVIDQGASASGGNRSTSIYIRGLGQSDFTAFADPAVGVYIDGVYFSRSVGSMMDVVDLDRIEVLKGPQGTLFGKNTMGGAVTMTSKMPTGDFGGYGQVTAGRFNQLEAKAGVEFPIVADQLAARIAVSNRRRDGYTRSQITGQDLDDTDSLGARGILRWTPSEDAAVVFAADVTRVRESGQSMNFLGIPTPTPPALVNLFNAFVASQTPYVAFDNRWISTQSGATQAASVVDHCYCQNLDVWGVSGTVEWSLTPNMTLTSISAYRESDSDEGTDLDGTPLNYHTAGVFTTQRQVSQELRLSGLGLGERLNWLGGLYYFDEKIDETNLIRIVPGLFEATGVPATANLIDLHVHPRSEAAAAFAHMTYKWTDRLSLTAGLRYNYEKETTPADVTRIQTGVPILPATVGEASWTSSTPKASIEYKATEEALLYVSVAKGFKSGGFNYAITSATSFLPYGPENVTAYEAGFKTDWLERRLRVNGAAFYNRYSDLQLRYTASPGQFTCPAGQPLFCSAVVNASSVDITGGELDITARPARGLEVLAGVGYVRDEFKEVDPLLLAANIVTFDTQLPRTPEWTANAAVQYEFPVASYGRLTLRADYSYRDEAFTELANSPIIAQGAYGLVNARIAFASDDDRWEFALAGLNLSDEKYVTAGTFTNSLGYAVVHYGTPRTWAASATYRFGD